MAASTVAFRFCSSLDYSPLWMVIAGGAGRPLLWMRFPRSIGSECVQIIIIKPSAWWNFSRGQLRDECVGSSIDVTANPYIRGKDQLPHSIRTDDEISRQVQQSADYF